MVSSLSFLLVYCSTRLTTHKITRALLCRHDAATAHLAQDYNIPSPVRKPQARVLAGMGWVGVRREAPRTWWSTGSGSLPACLRRWSGPIVGAQGVLGRSAAAGVRGGPEL